MARKPFAQTIAVTARSSSRFAGLKLRYPDGTPRRWPARFTARYPAQVEVPDHDAAAAMELIGNTGELPASTHGLVVIITHYRHAHHALATQILNSQVDSAIGCL
jgi:hypothetical protein